MQIECGHIPKEIVFGILVATANKFSLTGTNVQYFFQLYIEE